MTRSAPCLPLFAFFVLLVPSVEAFLRPPRSRSTRPRALHSREPARDLYTTSLFENPSEDPLLQDKYWEDLFMEGSAARGESPSTEGTGPEEAVGVDVVSFDLDDTLWCGKTVISNANKALQAFLQANYPAMVSDELPTVSALMWVLAKKHPEEFLEDPEDSKSVVRFTDLRKLALTALAKKCDMPEPQAVAEAAFQAWHDARHDVQELFFPGALDLLQELKARGLRLCAITNGNCDISRIAAFEGVFEFCINAEKVEARKRTGRPYMAAIQQAGVGEGVGKRWVHIGDDFSEDILAAKSDFKLRTIWYHTAERKAKVEEEQLAAKRARLEGQEKENKDSSRTSAVEGAVGPLKLSSLASTFKTSTEPFFKDKAAVHVSTMETDDYLTHFITKEFVDGEVEDLKEIVPLIDNWVRQGKQRPPKKKAVGGTGSTSDTSSGVDCIEASQDKEESKFCIVCRAILPVRAKFCSACGEKQE